MIMGSIPCGELHVYFDLLIAIRVVKFHVLRYNAFNHFVTTYVGFSPEYPEHLLTFLFFQIIDGPEVIFSVIVTYIK